MTYAEFVARMQAVFGRREDMYSLAAWARGVRALEAAVRSAQTEARRYQ